MAALPVWEREGAAGTTGLGQSGAKTRRRPRVDPEPSLALLGNFGRRAQHRENSGGRADPAPCTAHWPFSEWPRPEVLQLETLRLGGVPPRRRFLTSRPATATAASPYGRPGAYGLGGWLVGLWSGRGPRQVGPAQGGPARVRRSAGAGRGRKRPPWAPTECDRGRLPPGRSGRVGATCSPLTCPQPPPAPARVLPLCQACQFALIPCLFPKL